MSVPARLSIVTLGVADLPRSVGFYTALGWVPASASQEGIAWFVLTGSALGLFPREELADDANVPAGEVPEFSGVTLAINVESEAIVDEALALAQSAGATITKPGTTAEWGGYSGSFADPDGHLWEVAFNPGFPLRDDGSIVIP
jgi:catechol 2,3-dioxygenase-like lactoylglutathione lyase family enzyme